MAINYRPSTVGKILSDGGSVKNKKHPFTKYKCDI